ncbi:odorant receptor 13a-like [Belonocnema kinseyi]|uniref:odorant receptor 13a-like n=1 Tax=Belonocnema kinseyi TaxID=2817044 RepID=UPI00143D126D|nr:odorant receptor 13a-like [Belonocnema kinseyi]
MESVMPTKKLSNQLKYIERVTWPMGCWPLENDMISVFLTFLFVIIQVSLVATVSIEISLGYGNLDEKIRNIDLQKFGTLALIKVLIVRFYHRNLAFIIVSVNEDWLSSMKTKYLGIMKGYASRGNTVLYAYAIIDTLQLSMLFLINFPTFPKNVKNNSTNNSYDISEERVLFLGTKSLLGDYSTTSYLLIYILQIVQCFSTSFGNFGIDFFFFSLAMQICGQLEILFHDMSDFNLKSNLKATKYIIVSFIKRHQHLLKEVEILETTFNLIILTQLAVNISGICTYGIQVIIAMQNSNTFSAVMTLLCTLLLMSQLLLYCYAGDLLSSKVSMIKISSYQFPWYDVPCNLAMDMCFVMARAGYPFRLTAGKFMTMNMDSFTKIVKVTFSYFSVLRLMLNN